MALFSESQALQGLTNQVNGVVSNFESTWKSAESKAASEYSSNIAYKNQTIQEAKHIVAKAKSDIANFVNTLTYTKAAAQSAANKAYSELDTLLNDFITSINNITVPKPPISPAIYHPQPTRVSSLNEYLGRIGIPAK